ncbi:MAG: PilZ domain-containing protein [Mariprofundales bacterium]|nr:PilZ domain-containing protein [Mariprofundales bacterium]
MGNMIEHQQAKTLLQKRLRGVLGNQHPESQQLLMQGLLNTCDVPVCNQALRELLQHNIEANRLMMVLLHCQPILFHIFANPNDPESWRDLTSRFYQVQNVLIEQSAAKMEREFLPFAALDTQRAQQEAESMDEKKEKKGSPVATDSENADAIDWLSQQSKIRVFNIFRGVVINARCELYQINKEEDSVSIELNQELGRVLTAAANSATLVCNEHDSCGFPLTLISHHPGLVKMQLHPPKPLYIDQRDNLDVQVQERIPVEIRKRLYLFPTATLADFSSKGIGVITPKDDRVEIRHGDTLEFRFQIGSVRINAEGQVRGARDLGDSQLLGIELAINRANQSQLQREVFRIQREIIVALNQEQIPEKIAANIR